MRLCEEKEKLLKTIVNEKEFDSSCYSSLSRTKNSKNKATFILKSSLNNHITKKLNHRLHYTRDIQFLDLTREGTVVTHP